jgi:integration host factor subunit beta
MHSSHIQGRAAKHFAVGGFMTKADLVDHVTALGDLTRRDGEVIVETLFDSIIDALKANDKVEVRGFGSFRSRQRKPRTGRNPKTGESVAVPAKRVPYFKPSKELRDLVNPDEANGSRKSTAKKDAANGVVDPHHPPAM